MTTFRRDYTGANAPRSESFKPPMDPMQSDAPFDDNTTFKTDYRPWEGQRPQPHVPESYRNQLVKWIWQQHRKLHILLTR